MAQSRFVRYKSHGRCVAVCERCDTDSVVRDGLAYSPADMARMTERGMPVNSLAGSKVFCDGDANPSFFVSAERERFVDVADLWEQHVILRDKARKAAITRSRKSKS